MMQVENISSVLAPLLYAAEQKSTRGSSAFIPQQ